MERSTLPNYLDRLGELDVDYKLIMDYLSADKS